MEKIVVLVNGGHAKSLIDVIERENKYEISRVVINENAVYVKRYSIIGNDNDLDRLFHSGIENAGVGIGFLGKSDLREKIYMRLKEIGYRLPVIRDPSAVIAKLVQIGEGSFIAKGAIINFDVCIERCAV